MYGCQENSRIDLAFTGKKEKRDYLIVTTIFLIPNGNMFLRIHIIFTMDHKTT